MAGLLLVSSGVKLCHRLRREGTSVSTQVRHTSQAVAQTGPWSDNTGSTLACPLNPVHSFPSNNITLAKSNYIKGINSVQLLSPVRLFATPWMAAHQAGLSPVHHQLPEPAQIMSIESVMPSNFLILCRPLLLLPSILPSIRVFSNESVLPIRQPKYWSFSFSISPSNEYSWLISFRIDWLELFVVQDPEKSYPAPHFKSINSLALSLLYGPTLISIHDYWKNHSFNYTDLCEQSSFLAF